MSDKPTRTYTHGNLTVEWYADRCEHCEHCWRSMPEVFDPERRPWIQLQNGNHTDIWKTCRACPSGALQAEIKE